MAKTNIKSKEEKKIKKNIRRYKMLGLFSIPLLSLIAILPGVMAHCPLCTVATFVLTILGFYFAGLFGPANTYRIFGMEKIIFGTVSGAAVSFTTFFTSNKIKKRNGGKTL